MIGISDFHLCAVPYVLLEESEVSWVEHDMGRQGQQMAQIAAFLVFSVDPSGNVFASANCPGPPPHAAQQTASTPGKPQWCHTDDWVSSPLGAVGAQMNAPGIVPTDDVAGAGPNTCPTIRPVWLCERNIHFASFDCL